MRPTVRYRGSADQLLANLFSLSIETFPPKVFAKFTRPSFLASKVVISNYMYATGGVRKRDNSTPLSELN